MSLETLVTRGPWKLVRARSATPQWVGWVHDDAEGWRREVVRILEAAESGPSIEAGTSAELLRNQKLLVFYLHQALGQLARCLDLPMPCFEPWAKLQWINDSGADPWPGWTLPRPLWRVDAFRAAAQGTEQIRGSASVLTDLWYRVRLSEEGLLVPPAPGLAADVSMALEAPGTPRGVDTRNSVCFIPSAVHPDFTRAPPGAERSVWNCVNYSAWWPGFGAAESDAWVSALVPLRWHWEMAAGAAARVRDLGSVEGVMTASRQWIAMKNLKAIASVERLTGIEIELPEDLLTWTAENSGPGRWQDTTAHQVLNIAADMVSGAGPIGAVIGLVITGLDLVATLIGTARGFWVDPWGRREVVLESPRLTGFLDLPRPEEPTHPILPAPNYTATATATGPSRAARRHAAVVAAAHSPNAAQRAREAARPRTSGPATRTSTKGTGGGKLVVGAAAVYALSKLVAG